MCVCVLFNFVSFFYSGNSSTYFKNCVDLCKKKKKNLVVRDVKRFQFLSTILTGIRSRQSEQKRFGFLKEERNSVVTEASEHRRPGLSNNLNQWTFITCE